MGGLFGGGDNGAAEAQAQIAQQERQMAEQEARLKAQETERAQQLQAEMSARRRGARALLSEERDDELGLGGTTLGGQ